MGRRLVGKTAIITGAAQGIGAATAELFAAEGARVVVADVNEELGTARAESIRSAGGVAEFFWLDVTDFEQWKGCIAFTEERFGKLTILVNNAGISYSLTIAETTVEHWNRVIATNQTSVYYGMKLAIEATARTGEPCAIANASSVDGLVGESRFFAYCAAKGAVTLMTKAAALHCAEQNLPIRINSVHPGYVQSPMAEADAAQSGQTVEEYTREFAARHPVGHLGAPEDIAAGYLYLCSDEARFVTGTQLAIDGGFTAQ